MAAEDIEIPRYEVRRGGDDVPFEKAGRAILARVLAFVPAFEASDNLFDVVGTVDGVSIQRLHKMGGDKALMYMLVAWEPKAAEKLDRATGDMEKIVNIWHDPAEGVQVFYPEEFSEVAPNPEEIRLRQQSMPSGTL